MKILALRGDGIGPEIVGATIKVLKTISQKFNSVVLLIISLSLSLLVILKEFVL